MGSIVRFQESKAALLLKVSAGIHEGVSLSLDGQIYRIGSAADCDLTLSDRDVSSHHMTFQRQGSDVLIEAIGGEVVVDGHALVPVGHGSRCSMPCAFQIGGATIELSWPRSERNGARKIPRGSSIAIGGAALSLLTIAAVQAGVGDFLSATNASLAHHSIEQSDTTARTAPTLIAAGSVATSLTSRLAAAGLGELKVEAEGTRLTVSGNLDEDQRKVWGNIQAWFDRTYGGSYVLTSLVGAVAAKVYPKFNLQAVWFGDTPYAIGSDGTRLYKGAALEDGWIIKDIRDGRLVAGRQNEEFVLTF